MYNRTDIEFGTDLGILYNKAQENNIKAEILRCKEIGMQTEIFEIPVKTEVDIKKAYNSYGTCYGVDYLFSDESIRCIRYIHEAGYDITNLLKVRRGEYADKGIITVATFDEQSIKEILMFMNDGFDPTIFMKMKTHESGRECGWSKFNHDEIREIAIAIRHGFDYKILLEEGYHGCKHYPFTMRLINQAMAMNLPSLKYITMPCRDGHGYAFGAMSHEELNYSAINVPQVFDIITRINAEGMAVYDYPHMFYIVRAYEFNIPSKKLFIELDEKGCPKLDCSEMEIILKKEVKDIEDTMVRRDYKAMKI